MKLRAWNQLSCSRFGSLVPEAAPVSHFQALGTTRMSTVADAGGRISTGLSGLDDILGGGFDPDRLYLVEGTPGSGKTTLALQFLLEGVKSGEKVLYITLSESESELRLVATRHGWSLDGVPIFQLVPPEASHGPDQEVTLFHPAEMELGETTKMIFEQVRQNSPSPRGVRQPLGDAAAGAELPALPASNPSPQAFLRRAEVHGAAARRPVLPCGGPSAPFHRTRRHPARTDGPGLWSRAAAAARDQDARHRVPRRLPRFHDRARGSVDLSRGSSLPNTTRSFTARRLAAVRRDWMRCLVVACIAAPAPCSSAARASANQRWP